MVAKIDFNFIKVLNGYKSIAGILLILSCPQLLAAIPPDSMATCTDKILISTFSNDATFRTDYYFTQGITLNMVWPELQKSPLTKLTIKSRNPAKRYYGVAVVYDGFTPLKITDPNLRYNDRPYAAYIYTSHYLVLNNPLKNWRISSGVDIGIIGPEAGAKGFQTKVHEWTNNPKPLGWDYQVRTDLVLGYRVELQKQLLSFGNTFELIGGGKVALGTLNTNAAGTILARVGKLNSYFQNLGVSSKENRVNLQRFQFYAQGSLEARVVGYNATLQGGLLNKTSPAVLRADQIKRGIWHKTAGLVCAYKGFGFGSSIIWSTPEFIGARHHKWIQFNLAVAF